MSLFRKILIGYDQSEQAEDALALGRLLGDATGAKLVVAGVFRFDPLFAQAPWFEEAETDCARSVAQAAESLGAEPETIPSTSPARGLHDLAEDIDAGLIVVGSSHRGRFGRALAGSVGLSLLHGAPCAVAIAPRGYATQPVRSVSTVVVGFDGSAESGLALLEAEQLAREAGSTVRLVSAIEGPAKAPREVAQASLHEACRSVPERIPVESDLVTGAAAEELRRASAKKDAIVVVGSRGYGPLRRAMLGSVSEKLVDSAQAPVIVCPRPSRSNQAAPVSARTAPAR